MSNYLNTNVLLENYKNLYRSKYFIDKSLIIDSLNQLLNTSDKYVCITRPRRFGKSSIVSMIGAYYSKAVKSKEIFDNLKISSSESYMENLNKYNVISISFNEIPDNMKSYDDYINMIRTQLIRDITEKYTHYMVGTKSIHAFLMIFCVPNALNVVEALALLFSSRE